MNVKLILAFILLATIPTYAAPLSSGVTVIAPAKFKIDKDREERRLLVSDSAHAFDIVWGRGIGKEEFLIYPFDLKSGELYTFTVEEVALLGGSKVPELVKVVQDGKVVYDREICEVHHRKMDLKEVGVSYGFPLVTGKQPTSEETRTLFPHYSEVVLGGCIVRKTKTYPIYVCPECKAAHEKWVKENVVTTK